MAAKHLPTHFPPSPPPSPPRRRHHKNHLDPLFDLDAPLPSPTSSNESPETQESFLTQIILTPLLMTSFLLSLFLVNRSDRARRTHQSSLLAYLSPTTWLDPEPYQDPSNTTWERRGSISHVQPHGVLGPEHNQTDIGKRREKTRSWHLHKKIRKVARLEIDDAFALRRHVIVVMLGMSVGVVVGLWMGGRWVLSWVASRSLAK